MPRLIVTEAAVGGLERCRRFLAERNVPASERAARVIGEHLRRLQSHPEIGRPFDEFRELVIGFGDSGYVALYLYEADDDAVYVVAFRHQGEAGY